MLPLTKQERQVILFLMVVVLAGTAIDYAKKQSVQLRGIFCFDPAYGKININTADAAVMKELPGIGDTFAQRIIDYRLRKGSFADIEEVRKVPGMNGSRYERIKATIVVE
jgi:competence ComEA-like helix-hairpin-helix protein